MQHAELLDNDGFVLVTHGRTRRKTQNSTPTMRYKEHDTRATRKQQFKLPCRLKEYQESLKEWNFPESIIERIASWRGDGQHVQVACLGSGSPSESTISQWQLALACVLSYELNPEGELLIHDPCFHQLDKDLLAPFPNIRFMDSDADLQKYQYQKLLLYMPHCDAELYEVMLNSHPLESVCIIGNSQSHYRLRSTMTTLQSTPTICNLADMTIEISLPKGPWDPLEGSRVFNDTSIHLYRS